MVRSLLKKANLSTPHRPSPCAAIFLNLLVPPRFGALSRENESSGSQQVYRKLFPGGPHSSENILANALRLPLCPIMVLAQRP